MTMLDSFGQIVTVVKHQPLFLGLPSDNLSQVARASGAAVDVRSPAAVSARLRALLRLRGKTAGDLARSCGVNKGVVSRWLSRGGFSSANAVLIAEALGTTERWLLLGGPEVSPGEKAPDISLARDEDLDPPALVARYPRRYTPQVVATALWARHKKGRPEGGWMRWMDDVKAADAAEPNNRAVALAEDIEKGSGP